MKKIIKSIFSVSTLLFSALTAQALEVGEKAPLFVADSTKGKIELKSILRQKPVVLAFYYADFTPV